MTYGYTMPEQIAKRKSPKILEAAFGVSTLATVAGFAGYLGVYVTEPLFHLSNKIPTEMLRYGTTALIVSFGALLLSGFVESNFKWSKRP